ncbi:MAG: squalene synthase HpnC [Elusimicrobia bacterium RBG_16_66_12]|nr:MAG: squalene synthase HpnC [Elusimicrobia bacterium RBG_16_66_12]
MDPKDVSGAYRFCQDLADRHYENFPVASRLLPRRLRKHVAALYAFARIADDFSDETEYEGVRRERLEEWRRQLAETGEKPPEHPVFLALSATLKELDLPKQPFDDLLSAFLQDTEKKRYETFAEVLDYCRRSANPVGRIVLMIHGYRDEELFRYSDAICTALQLANFWQDVSVDLKKDRVYIPEEDFKAYGYFEADLRMGVCNERFKALMKFELARTRSLFDQGKPLPGRLRWPLSLEIRLTWLGGMQILKLIHKLDFDTLRTRPALTKRDWIPLVARALVGA